MRNKYNNDQILIIIPSNVWYIGLRPLVCVAQSKLVPSIFIQLYTLNPDSGLLKIRIMEGRYYQLCVKVTIIGKKGHGGGK